MNHCVYILFLTTGDWRLAKMAMPQWFTSNNPKVSLALTPTQATAVEIADVEVGIVLSTSSTPSKQRAFLVSLVTATKIFYPNMIKEYKSVSTDFMASLYKTIEALRLHAASLSLEPSFILFSLFPVPAIFAPPTSISLFCKEYKSNTNVATLDRTAFREKDVKGILSSADPQEIIKSYLTTALSEDIRNLLPEVWRANVPSFHLFLDLPLDMQNVILDLASISFPQISTLSQVCKDFRHKVWGSKSELDFSRFINCRKLGGDAFANILSQAGPRLRSLDISGCSGVDNKAFFYVSQAKNLTYLDISRCRSVDRSLQVLCDLVNLRTLICADSQGFVIEGQKSEYSFLAGLTRLEVLDLSYGKYKFDLQADRKLLEVISKLTQLKKLVLAEPSTYTSAVASERRLRLSVILSQLPLEEFTFNRTLMNAETTAEIFSLFPEENFRWKFLART